MTFRRIDIESTGPLGDRRIVIGGNEEPWGFAENTLTTYVAGGFVANAHSRYLLMGKYEVTRLQYTAVLGETCPKPATRLRLPQGRVNWHDAVEFARRYSLWLLEHAADDLPVQDQQRGFVRLPTEAEWEYAARGGGKVSVADFRERTFPMPEGLARYVWFAGTTSANGRAQLAGLLEPNPLGLHDMLGNLDEIVQEPFRMNRLDRLHGQTGGFVVRGGNYFTAQQEIRSAQRQEVPFYDGKDLWRSKTTGFRVVVSVPVITSPERLRRIQEAWAELGSEPPEQEDGVPASGLSEQPLDDPLQELSAIAAAAVDLNMKKRLGHLRSVVRANIEVRNAQRDRAAREALRLGGVLCQKLRDDGHAVESLRRVYDHCSANSGADNVRCRRYRDKLDTERSILDYNVNIYADSVIEVAENYSEPVLVQQLDLLTASLEARAFQALVPFTRAHLRQLLGYARNWRVSRQDWFEQCRAVEERAERGRGGAAR
jgi:hypothetical protein